MKYRIVDGPESVQRSPEWYAFRRGKIGMSQAGAIMGVNPWQTRLQLFEQIVLEKETPLNEFMIKGIELEPLALETFNNLMRGKMWDIPNGCSSVFKPVVLQSLDFHHLLASLDGFNGAYHVEIKVTSKLGPPPPHYYAQLQGQMMVLGTGFCFYFPTPDGIQGDYHIVKRDDDYIRKLLSEILAFISSLIDFKPPEPTDRDEIEITDSRLLSLSRRYRELEEEIQDRQLELDDIKKELIAHCPHSRAKIGGLKLSKIIRKGAIEYAKILEEYHVHNAESYRKIPTEFWRIA